MGHTKSLTKVPNLDDKCSLYFSYRDLIECGETVARLRIDNQPTQLASFESLRAIALNILDPVKEEFGDLELTYGFASPNLLRHLKKGVAPKLDQHSSYELNSSGRLICNRGGAAVDLKAPKTDAFTLASWINSNLSYDRLYVYESFRPLHISYSASNSKKAYLLRRSPSSGRRIPSPLELPVNAQ